jgi:hypothetical protein
MPLLSESFASILQTDKAVALAAAVLIGTHHGDVLQWVWDMLGPHEPEPRRRRKRRKTKANGASGKDLYLDRRRAQRDADDQALLKAMRCNCEGSINDWATTIGKSRTSCVSGLHRLRAAGLTESVEGRWKLTEEPALREPPAKWIAPLSAREHRAHAAA